MRLRGIAIASACVVLVAAAVLVGCTSSVTRSLTGVSVQRVEPTTCVKDCNDSFALLYKAEQKKHLEEVEKCQALPQSGKNDCLVAESVRHDARKTELGLAKIACQNGCIASKVSG